MFLCVRNGPFKISTIGSCSGYNWQMAHCSTSSRLFLKCRSGIRCFKPQSVADVAFSKLLCMYVHMLIHVHVYLCGSRKSILGVLLNCFPFCIFRQGLSLNLELPDSYWWACLSPSAEISNANNYVGAVGQTHVLKLLRQTIFWIRNLLVLGSWLWIVNYTKFIQIQACIFYETWFGLWNILKILFCEN